MTAGAVCLFNAEKFSEAPMFDKTLECIQCGEVFTLSAAEQERIFSRGFDEPKRCPDCRRHKFRSDEGETPKRRREKKRHYRQKFEDDY